jgi:hypothetical protein
MMSNNKDNNKGQVPFSGAGNKIAHQATQETYGQLTNSLGGGIFEATTTDNKKVRVFIQGRGMCFKLLDNGQVVLAKRSDAGKTITNSVV